MQIEPKHEHTAVLFGCPLKAKESLVQVIRDKWTFVELYAHAIEHRFVAQSLVGVVWVSLHFNNP